MRARDRLHSLTVADVMATQVVRVTPDCPVARIVDLFAAKGISSAPVVDERERCVGVVSAVDVIAGKAGGRGELARDVMTSAVKSVGGQQPLLKAAQLMCANHVHRLPVTDEESKVVGVVSTMDIVAALLNAIDEAEASVFAGNNR